MDKWTPSLLVCLLLACGVSGSESQLGTHPRFICSPVPPDTPCFPSDSSGHHHNGHYAEHHSRHYSGHLSDSWWDVSEEATPTILHLRESSVQQKETILDQRETIRELTSKLALCQGFGHGQYRHYYGNEEHTGDDTVGQSHWSSPEQMSRMLETVKERLENLQTHNMSMAYAATLKELLQRKISALEQQMLHHTASITDGSDDDGHNDGQRDANDNHHDAETGGHGHLRASHRSQDRQRTHDELDEVLKQLTHGARSNTGTRKRRRPSGSFQIGFPMRTNYMYGRVKQTVTQEIYAMTLCMWLKGIASGIGTPFSYSAPGQANELVLIEWGDKPMELIIKDTAVILPLSLHDGKWHHVCVTWLAQDGVWEVYQDGAKRGSGDNLNAWQPINPGGVIILGQEQDSLGGRFDATQAFVGEISDLQLWSHTLAHHDIYNLASCRGHMTGDIISWVESVVELHGGVTKYPFHPCH